ncbi:MAG: hypothetical protein M3Y62_05780 [Candidatus Dormibacteraeota bacterium]|nr:hypothetical protein [Candidatus Dormibacteraeota bacterium]
MNSPVEHVGIPEESGPQLDSFAVANRWYNLLASSVLCLGGLTFGFVAFQEQDLPDKADDGAFLVIALLALSWYIWPGNRFKRSRLPILLGALALVIQVLGLIVERDDPKAFGDNIGGVFFFVVTMGLIAFQYRRPSCRASRVLGRPS